MIDFIFVVDDSKNWHAQNLKRNPHHYSALRYLGAKKIARIQEDIGAAVYYNTLVRCEDKVVYHRLMVVLVFVLAKTQGGCLSNFIVGFRQFTAQCPTKWLARETIFEPHGRQITHIVLFIRGHFFQDVEAK